MLVSNLVEVVKIAGSSVMNVAKHDIHLVQGLALSLRKEDESPNGGNHHPAGEEVPSAEGERLEDVGESLGDGELSEPLDHGSIGTGKSSEGTGENLSGDDPGDTVKTERPAE